MSWRTVKRFADAATAEELSGERERAGDVADVVAGFAPQFGG
ncbi:hypothetical protein [Streptomyces sp. NBC_00631]